MVHRPITEAHNYYTCPTVIAANRLKPFEITFDFVVAVDLSLAMPGQSECQQKKAMMMKL